jgi:hypothetical protein
MSTPIETDRIEGLMLGTIMVGLSVLPTDMLLVVTLCVCGLTHRRGDGGVPLAVS